MRDGPSGESLGETVAAPEGPHSASLRQAPIPAGTRRWTMA